MAEIFKNGLELIGNTPLVLLEKIHPGPAKIYAKLESVNPGGSIKDRPALRIIQKAYEDNLLRKGQPVVEVTSGNMGAGLAVVCNLFGNPFIATISAGNSPERVKMMKALGAEVILVPQVDGTPGRVTGNDIAAAEEKAIELARNGAFYVDQFNNPGNPLAHEEGTGSEIWNALGSQIDGFVAIAGTGATFIGCSRLLKRKKPSIVCAVVEPTGAQALEGLSREQTSHIIQGTGYGIIPSYWDPSLPDDYIAVSDSEATHFKDLLAKKESLYVGFSSGANVCAAIKLLKSGKVQPDASIVTILCDTGLKY